MRPDLFTRPLSPLNVSFESAARSGKVVRSQPVLAVVLVGDDRASGCVIADAGWDGAGQALRGSGAVNPFRSIAFRWLWTSSGLANGAQMMERTTTAWLVLQLGGGALAVGLAFAARSLPGLLFGLAAGTVADRVDRRRQILTVAVLAAVLMAFTSWLVGTGTIQVWQVIGIAFLTGCVQMSDSPARQALVLDTTSRSDASLAMTLNALAARGFGAAGAIGAGALIPTIGVGHCYFVIASIYALEIVPILALPGRRESHATVMHPPLPARCVTRSA